MDGKLSGVEVSERLFEWLDATGETTTAVAAGSGISRNTISSLLNAHIAHPRLSTMRKLARHFGVSVEAFLAGPRRVSATSRVAAKLRALPFIRRVRLLDMVAHWGEPIPKSAVAVNEPTEESGQIRVTFEDVIDFISYSGFKEAREVLFTGAETEEDKKMIVDVFTLATSALIGEGHIAAGDAVERLGVARQIQVGAA